MHPKKPGVHQSGWLAECLDLTTLIIVVGGRFAAIMSNLLLFQKT
jgi:hypothetical protein